MKVPSFAAQSTSLRAPTHLLYPMFGERAAVENVLSGDWVIVPPEKAAKILPMDPTPTKQPLALHVKGVARRSCCLV